MSNGDKGWITNFIWGIADDVLRDLYVTAALKDDTELVKQFMDNESFARWLKDTDFDLTYEAPHTPAGQPAS